MRIYLFIILTAITFNTKAQSIYGTIKNKEGRAIPFANVYIKELKTGTSSNINGAYRINIPIGNWTLNYQYLGYETQTKKISITKKNTEINITLKSRDYKISEVKILASGEDPAYYVMRKAIALGHYYTNQIDEYYCQVYLKGRSKIINIPFLLEKKLKSSNIKEGQTYITENITKVNYKRPDILNQKTIAIRSSEIAAEIDPMPFITTNLYNTRDYDLISPLDKKAFSVYTYSLIAIFEDNGYTINKIKVTPKRKGKDLFSGYINIVENYWNIHSVNLRLKMPMANIHMHQIYTNIEKNVWMPTSLDFDVDFNGLGFKAKIFYIASITDYKIKINTELKHNLFTPNKNSSKAKTDKQKTIRKLLNKEKIKASEMRKLSRILKRKKVKNSDLEIKINKVKIAKSASMKDSIFWKKIRPIPLSRDEKTSFLIKDSTVRLHNSKTYLDSVKIENSKFKVENLFFGKKYIYKRNTSSLNTPGIFNIKNINFNTVDGFTVSAPFQYIRKDTLKKLINISSNIDYAFARKKISYSLIAQLRYNGFNRAWLAISIGDKSVDFNKYRGINKYENAIYSLLLRKNKMKLYNNKHITIHHITDITNGLSLKTKINYSRITRLYNNTNFSFNKSKSNIYTNNTVENIDINEFKDNKSFSINNTLSYTPRQKYYIITGNKVLDNNNEYPSFSLNYKHAFSNILNSKSKYIFLGAGIEQTLKTGFSDKLEYKFKMGKFFNNKNTHFSERMHFGTNSSPITVNTESLSFNLLKDYTQSTINQFAEFHLTYTTDRLFLKRLPILNNSFFINEKLSFNYLTSKKRQNYFELTYGLSGIFMLIDVEIATSFESRKFLDSSIKIKLNL